jgi:hypothetical protein
MKHLCGCYASVLRGQCLELIYSPFQTLTHVDDEPAQPEPVTVVNQPVTIDRETFARRINSGETPE